MRQINKWSHLLTVSCLVLCTGLTHAADIRFSGYASIVGGMTLDEEETYLADDIGGGIYDDTLDFAPESLFALQADVDLEEGLTATAQIASRGANQYQTNFEWAYLSYKLAPSWSIQAGRKGDVLYKYSDYRDVGYSYGQARLPSIMYAAPFNAYDGVNLLNKHKLLGLRGQLNLYYGNIDTNSPFFSRITGTSVNMRLDEFHGIVWDVSKSWWEARIGVHRGELSVVSDTAIDLLGTGTPVADQTGKPTPFTYTTAAFSFDVANIIGAVEYSLYTDEDGSGLHNGDAGYAVFGYRIGDFVPTIAYSFVEEDQTDVSKAGGVLEFFPAISKNYTEFTLKYDFHTFATFKTTYAQERDDDDDTLNADIVSFGVDLVF